MSFSLYGPVAGQRKEQRAAHIVVRSLPCHRSRVSALELLSSSALSSALAFIV